MKDFYYSIIGMAFLCRDQATDSLWYYTSTTEVEHNQNRKIKK